MLEGPTAIAFIESEGDPAAVAKALAATAKQTNVLTPPGGVLEGKTLSGAEVDQLATLPPVDVPRQLVGAIIAPLSRSSAALPGRPAPEPGRARRCEDQAARGARRSRYDGAGGARGDGGGAPSRVEPVAEGDNPETEARPKPSAEAEAAEEVESVKPGRRRRGSVRC